MRTVQKKYEKQCTEIAFCNRGLEGVSTLLEDLKKDHAKISTDTILSNIRDELAYHGMILYLIPCYFTCFHIGLWIGHSSTRGPRAITELNEPRENRA